MQRENNNNQEEAKVKRTRLSYFMNPSAFDDSLAEDVAFYEQLNDDSHNQEAKERLNYYSR